MMRGITAPWIVRIGTLFTARAMPGITATKAVITEAMLQEAGRTEIVLQCEQVYFSAPKCLEGIVCHTETTPPSPQAGQGNVFRHRKIFFIERRPYAKRISQNFHG
jgi:hypothetical protein